MSLELVNSLASVGTFTVIMASAIAALFQVRHLRRSNQISTLMKLQDSLQSVEFRAARSFISTELQVILADEAGRERARQSALDEGLCQAPLIGNFNENLGLLVRRGIIDREIICALFGGTVVQMWHQLAPLLALLRSQAGDEDVWENFEYLAVVCEDWAARHPNGDYPKGLRRLPLPPAAPTAPPVAAQVPNGAAVAK